MKLKSKARYPVPVQVVLEPYGAIWIDLTEEHRQLIFIDREIKGNPPTEVEYWTVACYLWQEGFIEAIERRNARDIAKARKAKRAAK